MNRLTLSLATMAALAVSATGASAQMTTHTATKTVTDTQNTSASFTGHELAGQASVSLDQARATALKARPGVITDQELEKESGGTGLRYSFDIKANGHTFEIGVDARTGKVLENKTEGKNPD